MKLLLSLLPLIALISSCVSPQDRVSTDPTFNYQRVFGNMESPRPKIINSQLSLYTKHFAGITGAERNGTWAFEMLTSQVWLDEVMTGFIPGKSALSPPEPKLAWWKPDTARYSPYHMPRASFAPYELYIKKTDTDPVHIFIRR